MFAFGVPPQCVALGKARVAELTLVGLLSSVDPLVALELAGLPETFGADGTHKVPLACVDVLVSLLRAIKRKLFNHVAVKNTNRYRTRALDRAFGSLLIFPEHHKHSKLTKLAGEPGESAEGPNI